MRRSRRARIVATIGPASRHPDRILELARTGVDVFRMNFSHGSPEDHKETYDAVRAAEDALNIPLATLADLQGPKLRLGKVKGGYLDVVRDQEIQFFLKEEDALREGGLHLPHPEIFKALEPSTHILIDDGRIRFQTVEVDEGRAVMRADNAGRLSDRKGVNVPDAILPLPALTDKDHRDLQTALSLGCDWIAQSFVQRAEDVAELRKLVNGRAAILAKLEKPSALQQLDLIFDYVDAVMVARGDLGVEMAPEDVPVEQKKVVKMARARGKPVIVATQMLDSMVSSPVPTRAEASDVATAIYDGADAVMLSAETAVGEFAIETVSMMDRIIQRVERAPNYRPIMDADKPEPEHTGADAITAAASLIAQTIDIAALVCFTATGSTAHRASRERPVSPIVVLTPNRNTARRLALAWGIHSIVTPDITTIEEMVQVATSSARSQGFANPGEKVAIIAGMPFGTPGATNTLRVAYV
jgi:pyruvate kinase